VFDKFYRVDSGLTRATEGTGLGLTLCRAVVEAHGGRIDVNTAPGRGCTFTVTLPIAPVAQFVVIADRPVVAAAER
jgi:two-component system OmpR family sensor kinase